MLRRPKVAPGPHRRTLPLPLAQTVERFRTRAEAEGVSIETELSGKLPARGDEERTGQVMAALLDNAVRFTPKEGRVTVPGRRSDGRIEAAVTDTGPGMSLEHLPRLFDRFYRVETFRTRSDGGTGLGLVIARDLARAQGGELVAANTESGGAVFTLTVPGSGKSN